MLSNAFPGGYVVKLHCEKHKNAGTYMEVLLTEKGPGKGRGKGLGRPARTSQADFDPGVVQLRLRYPARGVVIKADKMRDLRLLLPYLDDRGKEWAHTLQGQQATLVRAGVSTDNPEEESDNPDDDFNMDYECPRRVPQP